MSALRQLTISLNSTYTISLKRFPLAEDEKSGYPNEPDLSPQVQFLDLLGDLWDPTVDVASHNNGDLKVCYAIMVMIGF